MSNQTAAVDRFLEHLDHPLKKEIEAVRAIILGTDEQITERIKWNAPSFGYDGNDRVTFRLHPNDRIRLVFHRGAKVKDSTDFTFEDRTGLLEWVTADRATVTLQDMTEVVANAAALTRVVKQWMDSTP